jgi:hypothetical protein
MRRGMFLFLLAALAVPGCATVAPPPETQLQLRAFQSRVYETRDTKMVLKAVLNVLQDEGFIVKGADSDLGFLTATREMEVEDRRFSAAFSRWLMGKDRWDKNTTIEATANVSLIVDKTRVRANFQTKTMDNKGRISRIEVIHDEAFYQEFFGKVDKGVFIEKEKL